MFSRKEKPKRPNRSAGSLAQYGIIEIPESLEDLGTRGVVEDENDSDLEAELEALTAGDDNRPRRERKTPTKSTQNLNLDNMIADSMKDIDSSDELSDGEDDSDLLNELKLITGDQLSENNSSEDEQTVEDNSKSLGVEESNALTEESTKLLQDRLMMYKIAEKKALEENESARARRYKRGIKVLEQLLQTVEAGTNISESDIPPPLPPSAIGQVLETPQEQTTPEDIPNTEDDNVEVTNSNNLKSVSVNNIDEESLKVLKNRQQEYKLAAIAWKRSGNMNEAFHHVNIVKQFDKVIEAINAGEAVDLSDMPPAPTMPTASNAQNPEVSLEKEESETQQHAASEATLGVGASRSVDPENIEMALKERLEVYRRTKIAAEGEGNSSKVRRYGRICKQFEDALKLYARGKPVPLDELPVPPGFPPLLVTSQSNSSSEPIGNDNEEKKITPQVAPDPVSPKPDNKSSEMIAKRPTPPPRTQIGGRKIQKVTSRAEKQMQILQHRQQEFKKAALNAKKEGDLELARDYLRQAKGIQPLINASIAGLPVDMTSVPLSPLAKMELNAHGLTGQSDDNFTLVFSEDCLEEASGTDEQIFENLESQLIKQIKWCLSTRDHSKALGDVPGYNKWERLALGYTRDLDMLRVRKRDALPPPQHHYETKTYAIVQSCTDLSDNDVEISIIRGINYSKEADTYVMFEFPFPTDSPPADRTSTIKASSNPEYESVFPLNGIIERTSRQCQRAFKRHALKCQVWAKGCSLNPIMCCTHPRGFFRSDNLLGTVTVKLQPLETKCTLHDSFPLMEGRKPTGGKLELKIRLRNPILTKQIEQITDKWLTIDQ